MLIGNKVYFIVFKCESNVGNGLKNIFTHYPKLQPFHIHISPNLEKSYPDGFWNNRRSNSGTAANKWSKTSAWIAS
jgi:hypothetical protein